MSRHFVFLIVSFFFSLTTPHLAQAEESTLPASNALIPSNLPNSNCANPLHGRALNLREVVNLALCNNPQTREMWANVQAQIAQTGINRASKFPALSANISANRSWPSAGTATNQQALTLSASYLLYDFGARDATLENSNQLLIAAYTTRDSTVQNVLLSTVQAFYQTQAARTALEAAQVSEQSAKESLAAALARYEAGTATPADKLSARTAYSQATLNRITAEGGYKKAQGTLANLLGMDADKEIFLAPAVNVTAPKNFSANVNALIEQARQRRPNLQAAIAQVRAAQASTEAARAAEKPVISLSATNNHNFSDANNTHNSAIGINVSIPIFSGYAPTYRTRAAEAQLDARNAQLDRLQLQIALEVWNEYQNLTTSTQTLQATADLLDSAEQSERATLGRYKAGMGSVLDVLNAQSALASARQQRIQALLNWNVSRAVLAQAMGQLDSDLLQTLTTDTATP
jgi:TolC family type I secretion outer membrane protein